MPGARRTRSLACKMKKAHELVTTGSPIRRHSLRDGFTGSFVLSLVIGLSCHHPQCDAEHRHRVNASVETSRPHDFAVRIGFARLASPTRPPHPALNVS